MSPAIVSVRCLPISQPMRLYGLIMYTSTLTGKRPFSQKRLPHPRGGCRPTKPVVISGLLTTYLSHYAVASQKKLLS